MLPFANKTDLETARKSADVPIDRHSGFLETMLKEHEHPDARRQLKQAWTSWLDKNHSEDEPTPSAGAGAGADDCAPRALTPTQEGAE